MEKTLSVIVPVYNAEKFIERCVDAILSQTYQNIELLLVNDGSKDGSLALCNALAEKDDRIKVFDKANGGAASARNYGLQKATGYYVGFCDADDYFDKDTFATLIKVMEENNLPTIECLAKVYNQNLTLIETANDTKTLERQTLENALKNILLHKGNVSLCTRITKAEYIKDLNIPEGRRVEDFYFTILLLLKTGETAIYYYPFYNYVTNENSVTHSATGSIYLDALYFFDKASRVLEEYSFDLTYEKEYYLLKMYYLLSITLTCVERKKYKEDVRRIKRELRLKANQIKRHALFSKKEKFVLQLAAQSFTLARTLFLIKNLGK